MGMAAILFVCAGCPHITITAVAPVANWPAGPLATTDWPNSTQVMMTPTVIDFGQPGGLARIVFVSFETAADANGDQNGVLRVIDGSGNEIAKFPDPTHPLPIPLSCQLAYPTLDTLPHLSPLSGLALGKFQTGQPVTIIGVLDDHTTRNAGIVAFQLVGNYLVPQWCSPALTAGDTIPRISAPAIAQLDASGTPSIIVDNKVYDSTGTTGTLRYSGGNCATCPRSRTPIVANFGGTTSRPQIFTGDAIYTSITGNLWSYSTVTSLPGLTANPNGAGNYVAYPAIADLGNNGQPEIIVTDVFGTTLRIFDAAGTTQLTSIALPNAGGACGGPPMIADMDGIPGPEIGVATCTAYTVFRYSGGNLSQIWSQPINDPSGGTTSTMFRDPSGVPRIYYADSRTLWVFRGTDGAILQQFPNTSGTAIEGPIIASFVTAPAPGPGRLIFAANNIAMSSSSTVGIRIFAGSAIGSARSVWNEHTYHQTNVATFYGDIPVSEPPSWNLSRNTYRVQQ